MTFTIGTRQFVVQLAFETMWCFAGSYLSLLTPITIVMSSPLAGALMMTFFAPPLMCARALSASVKRPVDSSTRSTPRSFHGRLAGSFSANTLISSPSTVIEPSPEETSPSYVRCTESYLKRCASVFVSVRSLTATKSRSATPCSFAARRTCRPMRPNPLMPTLIAIAVKLPLIGRRRGAGRPRPCSAAPRSCQGRSPVAGARPKVT